jgi:large subunit ribosomal protein L10
MNKEQKIAAAEEIGERLQASNAVFAVDYRGISVGQAAELRTKLREADASFTVVKNRLAKRVTADAGAEALDEHLVGPTALTYVEGDAVLAAKAIADFIKANQTISYKGGIMEGNALDPDQFNQIARLPGVDVLRGQLVGLAASPLSGLVRTLNQLIAGIAVQLGQVAEQGLVPADGAAPAGEAAPEASADDEPEAPESDEPAGSDEPAVDAEPPAEPGEPEEAPSEEESGTGSEASETDESEPEQTDETDKAEAGDSDEAEADESKED